MPRCSGTKRLLHCGAAYASGKIAARFSKVENVIKTLWMEHPTAEKVFIDYVSEGRLVEHLYHERLMEERSSAVKKHLFSNYLCLRG